MSEYQYYKFERLDGYLDAKARQALRAISSRAEISATSFQVYYSYSDLKAEPSELMLKYFDIGFYYADWGSIDAYIKLPAGTLPDPLLGFSSDGLYVHQSDEWQLLIFSLEEYDEYFDDEHADDFFQHLAALRSGLMQGDWRLVYFMWLKECDFNDEVERVPLIQFDFEHLSEEVQAFATLYDIPLALVKALAMVLNEQPRQNLSILVNPRGNFPFHRASAKPITARASRSARKKNSPRKSGKRKSVDGCLQSA
nr:hypothetical protein [Catenovulum sediminis]